MVCVCLRFHVFNISTCDGALVEIVSDVEASMQSASEKANSMDSPSGDLEAGISAGRPRVGIDLSTKGVTVLTENIINQRVSRCKEYVATKASTACARNLLLAFPKGGMIGDVDMLVVFLILFVPPSMRLLSAE